MAVRGRKRHVPSGVPAQRRQFSESSGVFWFTGLAVHPQVTQAFISVLGPSFFPPHNKTRSHRGGLGEIYHLVSTRSRRTKLDSVSCIFSVCFDAIKKEFAGIPNVYHPPQKIWMLTLAPNIGIWTQRFPPESLSPCRSWTCILFILLEGNIHQPSDLWTFFKAELLAKRRPQTSDERRWISNNYNANKQQQRDRESMWVCAFTLLETRWIHSHYLQHLHHFVISFPGGVIGFMHFLLCTLQLCCFVSGNVLAYFWSFLRCIRTFVTFSVESTSSRDTTNVKTLAASSILANIPGCQRTIPNEIIKRDELVGKECLSPQKCIYKHPENIIYNTWQGTKYLLIFVTELCTFHAAYKDFVLGCIPIQKHWHLCVVSELGWSLTDMPSWTDLADSSFVCHHRRHWREVVAMWASPHTAVTHRQVGKRDLCGTSESHCDRVGCLRLEPLSNTEPRTLFR